MPTTTNATRDTDADWQRDWRKTTWQRLDDGDEKHEKAALILERCINLLNEHDRRIKALEERPEKTRSILGFASNTVYTLVAVVALGFDAFTTVLALASAAIAVLALIHH